MGLAWSGATGGIVESFVKFLGIFAITQVPLAIAEGILTVIVFNLLVQHSRDVLVEQGILPAEAPTPDARSHRSRRLMATRQVCTARASSGLCRPGGQLAVSWTPAQAGVTREREHRMSPQTRNWLLAAVVILLVLVPLAYRGWIAEGTEWGGADMQGVAAVEELAGANFQAWFEPIYSPGDLERYFFGLQALLGTLLVAGFVGWLLGRSRARMARAAVPIWRLPGSCPV